MLPPVRPRVVIDLANRQCPRLIPYQRPIRRLTLSGGDIRRAGVNLTPSAWLATPQVRTGRLARRSAVGRRQADVGQRPTLTAGTAPADEGQNPLTKLNVAAGALAENP